MSRSKLAASLQDAYMMGDEKLIAEIKAEINAQSESARTPRKTNTIKINTVLNDDNASAIQVYDFLNKAFGDSWWEWEFETLERMLWIKYGVALEDINRDKIWAIRHVCRSDNAFADWFEFNQAALSFSGCIADFERLRAPSPGMVISTIKALNHIRPDRNSEFSNDVIKYICVLLKDEGIYTPPPSIAMLINKEMKKIVSPEISNKWMDILRRYQKMVSNNAGEIREDVTDTQAKRILKAEAAALKYGER